jgi:Glycosyl hydrolases family 16
VPDIHTCATSSNCPAEKSKDSSPDYSSYLTLRTYRQPTFQSSAEIDSISQNYHFLSARFLARVVGPPGACAGMFTYRPNADPQAIQEADIEILTSGPRNMVQYTNQPSNAADGDTIPQATKNATNPGERDWTQWMAYRVDWMPGMTSWYVDGESVANINFQTPRDPTGLIVNMWSDGGSWSGNMSTYDQAFLQLQWIQVVYNTSGPVGGNYKRDQVGSDGGLPKRKGTPGCRAVCSIDEQVNVTGTPALIYKSTGIAALGWKGGGMGLMIWIPLAIMWTGIFGVPLWFRFDLYDV